MNVIQFKIGILLGDGFHFLQVQYPFFRLREEGYFPELIGERVGLPVYPGKWEQRISTTIDFFQALREHWDLLIIPGGLVASQAVFILIHEAYLRGTVVAAIDSGVNILARSGILEYRRCSARHLPFMDIVLREAGAIRSEAPVTFDARTLTAGEVVDLPLFVLKILEILDRFQAVLERSE